MQDKQTFSKIEDDFSFLSSSKVYVPAPNNKLLKFHVSELERTEQINNFKNNPDGTENPDYGKPQPVAILKGMLDTHTDEDPEKDAYGQVYSTWITGYYDDKGNARFRFGDRSKFGKVAEALAGSVEAFQQLKAGEIVGLPFQCALSAGKKDAAKQNLNIDKIMPPADDQVRVETPLDAELAAAGIL